MSTTTPFAQPRRRACTRCGAALLLAGACLCMRAQTTATAPGSPLRNSAAMRGTPGEYLLRPGDVVQVNYRYTPEFDDTATITPDGRITLKNLGLVPAAGGTVADLQHRILQAASSQLVDPEITISLKEFDRPQIVVGGEVQLPGHFELRRPTTAMQAILMAGGPKQDSALNRVILFRRVNGDTAETHILHLNDVKNGHSHEDLLLQPDDMILVRHDKLSTLERYTKIVNLGVYFNPIGSSGIF